VEARVSAAWATIVVLTATLVILKAAGPVTLGARDLPPRLMGVIALFAPALLAALIMVETFAKGDKALTVDARAAGLAVAAVVLTTTRSMIGGVVSAAAVTALLRLIF
jgi:branched-subunit amino acid transport protein